MNTLLIGVYCHYQLWPSERTNPPTFDIMYLMAVINCPEPCLVSLGVHTNSD